MAGTSATTYSPQRVVTRDQMGTFLVRAFEYMAGRELAAGPSRFTDTAGNVHEVNINKAAEAGFAQGTSPTTYNPSGQVRRDQMGSFLARVLEQLYTEQLVDRPS